MPKKNDALFNELNTVMSEALLKIESLVTTSETKKASFVPLIRLFLLSVITMAADMVERSSTASSVYLYTELEAAIKQGGLRAVAKLQEKNSRKNITVSDIDPDDEPKAIHYMGQQLNIALFKHIHDLPDALRKPEILLRGTEALLCNLLHNGFTGSDPHELLDIFYKNVQLGLDHMKSKDIRH